MGKYLHNKTRTNKKATKENYSIITFLKFKEYTGPLFKELLISLFDDINNEAIALFMFRYFNNNVPSSFNDFFRLNKDVHYHNKRSSINVHKTADKIQARTNYQKHSIKYKRVWIRNNLPKSIKEIKAFNLLRKKIKTHFLHKQEN